MRRLRHHFKRSLELHRNRSDRGAVAVITALCMVALLGFTALAIDVGALYQERAELQSSADAAVLAVAQDCGKGLNCTGPAALPTAQQYAQRNVEDGEVNVAEPVFNGSTVRVNVSTREQDGTGALALTFAPILGIDEATVGATAAAQIIVPNKGPAVLPIVISPCDFDPTFGAGPQVLRLHSVTGTNKNSTATDCTEHSPTSGLNIPGGFGFINPDDGQCTATVEVDQKYFSDPGDNLPNACQAVLQAHIGKTVLLPLYKDLGAQGSSGWYMIDGWVAFKLIGWRFPSTSYANTTPGSSCINPCTGIIGEFVEFTSIAPGFTAGGPDYGASVVTMIE